MAARKKPGRRPKRAQEIPATSVLSEKSVGKLVVMLDKQSEELTAFRKALRVEQRAHARQRRGAVWVKVVGGVRDALDVAADKVEEAIRCAGSKASAALHERHAELLRTHHDRASPGGSAVDGNPVSGAVVQVDLVFHALEAAHQSTGVVGIETQGRCGIAPSHPGGERLVGCQPPGVVDTVLGEVSPLR